MKTNTVLSNEPSHDIAPIRFRCDPYLNLFDQLFPGEMRLFELLGLHPSRSKPLANPFDRKAQPEDFRNIGEHSIATAIAARAIAKALVETHVVPQLYTRRVMLRALLHDVFKPYELMYAKAYGPDAELGPCRERVLQSLAAEKIPSYLVAEILTAGRETGHNCLREFLVDVNGSLEIIGRRLGDKIVFLADALTSSSLPPRSETWFTASSERLTTSSARYPHLLNGGLVRTDDGKIEDHPDVSNLPRSWKNLGSYLELHIELSQGIEREICSSLIPGGVSSAEEAESLMLYLIRDSLRSLEN